MNATKTSELPTPPALASVTGSASGFRVRFAWIGSSGNIYYAVQQRRWWGWKTLHENYLIHEARAALKQLCETQNAKLRDAGREASEQH